MPRQPDPELEPRILKAAFRLWARGGSSALTIRALAREATTTTPSIYERYRDRAEILRAVRLKARRNLLFAVQTSRTVEQACRRYLQFAQQHRHVYVVLFDGIAAPPSLHEPWPTFSFFLDALARRLGGTQRQHTRLMLSIWALLHGTAELIIRGRMRGPLRCQMEHSCLDAIGELLRAAEHGPAKRHSGSAWPKSLVLGEGKNGKTKHRISKKGASRAA